MERLFSVFLKYQKYWTVNLWIGKYQ